MTPRQALTYALNAALRAALLALWPALILAGAASLVSLPAGAPALLRDWHLYLPQRVFPTIGHDGRVVLAWQWAIVLWLLLSVLFGIAQRKRSVVRTAWMSPLAFTAVVVLLNAVVPWFGLEVLFDGP